MAIPIRIDFVSDVSCPWCAIGLRSLDAALSRVADEVVADIHFQPFELNPQMSAQGEDVGEYIARKYGSSADEIAHNQEMIRARGAELGFKFGKRERIYNTFDAHRLLHWAEDSGQQKSLKNELFFAYFSEGRNISEHQVLEEVAAKAGLNAKRARQILASNEYADAVRAAEESYLSRGIHAVPAVVLDERYLIQGGQSVDTFERVLRNIAAEVDARQRA